MKEILKKPYYEMRCPKCGCHFRFDLDDIKLNSYSITVGVGCPNCGNRLQVRDNKEVLLPTVKVRYKEPKKDK